MNSLPGHLPLVVIAWSFKEFCIQLQRGSSRDSLQEEVDIRSVNPMPPPKRKKLAIGDAEASVTEAPCIANGDASFDETPTPHHEDAAATDAAAAAPASKTAPAGADAAAGATCVDAATDLLGCLAARGAKAAAAKKEAAMKETAAEAAGRKGGASATDAPKLPPKSEATAKAKAAMKAKAKVKAVGKAAAKPRGRPKSAAKATSVGAGGDGYASSNVKREVVEARKGVGPGSTKCFKWSDYGGKAGAMSAAYAWLGGKA